MITPTLIHRVRTLALSLWHSEPVRTVLAPLILAAVAASLIKAGVDGSIAAVVATVILGALGFTAQEIARARVTPVTKQDAAIEAAVGDTITAARQVLASNENRLAEIGVTGSEIADRIAKQAREYVGQHRR